MWPSPLSASWLCLLRDQAPHLPLSWFLCSEGLGPWTKTTLSFLEPSVKTAADTQDWYLEGGYCCDRPDHRVSRRHRKNLEVWARKALRWYEYGLAGSSDGGLEDQKPERNVDGRGLGSWGLRREQGFCHDCNGGFQVKIWQQICLPSVCVLRTRGRLNLKVMGLMCLKAEISRQERIQSAHHPCQGLWWKQRHAWRLSPGDSMSCQYQRSCSHPSLEDDSFHPTTHKANLMHNLFCFVLLLGKLGQSRVFHAGKLRSKHSIHINTFPAPTAHCAGYHGRSVF